jgi:hypothetical protein
MKEEDGREWGFSSTKLLLGLTTSPATTVVVQYDLVRNQKKEANPAKQECGESRDPLTPGKAKVGLRGT